jgi:hypothetical protein
MEGLGTDFQWQRKLLVSQIGIGRSGPNDQLLGRGGCIEKKGNLPSFAGKLGLTEPDAVRSHFDLDPFAMLLVLGISREELAQFCRA